VSCSAYVLIIIDALEIFLNNNYKNFNTYVR